jgi:glutamyl-tRNA reductase
MAWFNALAVTPIIVSLRQQAELIRQQELERALRRLDGLSDKQLSVINLLTQRIVNQMLHEPTVRLKRYAGGRHGRMYAQAIDDLFALGEREARE